MKTIVIDSDEAKRISNIDIMNTSYHFWMSHELCLGIRSKSTMGDVGDVMTPQNHRKKSKKSIKYPITTSTILVAAGSAHRIQK